MSEQFSILIDSRSRFETGVPGGAWLSMPTTTEQLHAANRLQSLGVLQSMSRKGDPYDNAVAENFFSCLKCELVHLRHFFTRREAHNAIFAYIESFYNTIRPHSALGWLSPKAFEHALRTACAA